MKRQHIVQVIILLMGAISILLSIIIKNTSISTILISVGCSILAVVIINFVEYQITLPDVNAMKCLNAWGLTSIYETRQSMNAATNNLIEKADEIDIAALGCRGLINFQGAVLKMRLKNGLKIRFLVPERNTQFITQKEIDEGATKDDINNNINHLIRWIQNTRQELSLNDDQLIIKQYKALPIESIMRIDNKLFTGPFMAQKLSHLTMAYEYKKGGKGYDYYLNYFNEIWNNQTITTSIS